MGKLDSIIEAGEDWHIERLVGIADDMRVIAHDYANMGPDYTSDMPKIVDTFIERLTRLKGQISDEAKNRIPNDHLVGTGDNPTG